jgi:hypothetical protein
MVRIMCTLFSESPAIKKYKGIKKNTGDSMNTHPFLAEISIPHPFSMCLP